MVDLDEQTDVNLWIKFGMRIGVSAALHPFDYAKTLIQLGYEPIAPRAGRTIFGSPALILPNIFQYVKYIKKVDGLAGCYRGVGTKVVGLIVSSIGSERVATKLGLEEDLEECDLDGKDEQELSESEERELQEFRFRKFEKQLKRDIVLHTSTIIIAQPFNVITVRMMAQFVGNETIYKSLSSSIREIWVEEGVRGFFSGLTPKLLCDLSCLLMASTATYYINKSIVKDRNNHQYVGNFANFVCSTIMYPLQVVSVCMAVSGSRLRAGKPPSMANFKSWTHCLRELFLANEHKRGSSLFWRYYRPTPNYNIIVPLPTLSKTID